MIKQKGIIVLILLVIVLLVAYVFYIKYYKGLVKEHFSNASHNDEKEYLYSPYPEIRFFNKQDYQGGRIYKHTSQMGGWLKGLVLCSDSRVPVRIEREVVDNQEILLYPLDFSKMNFISLFGKKGNNSNTYDTSIFKHFKGQDFTISAWIKFSSNDYQMIFTVANDYAASKCLHIAKRPEGKLRFGFYGNDFDVESINFNDDEYKNNYHHYIFTYDYSTNTRKFFLDGE